MPGHVSLLRLAPAANGCVCDEWCRYMDFAAALQTMSDTSLELQVTRAHAAACLLDVALYLTQVAGVRASWRHASQGGHQPACCSQALQRREGSHCGCAHEWHAGKGSSQPFSSGQEPPHASWRAQHEHARGRRLRATAPNQLSRGSRPRLKQRQPQPTPLETLFHESSAKRQ